MKYRILIFLASGSQRSAWIHAWAAQAATGDLIAMPAKKTALALDGFDAAETWRDKLRAKLPLSAAIEIVADRE